MRIAELNNVFGKYRTIYLDPPWPYDHRPRGRTDLKDIYEGGVMPLEEICRLPIRQLGHPEGCVVYLWCTWPKVRDGFPKQVLDAWGLRWRSEFVWDKEIMGMGKWLRKQTEVLIVATSGNGAELKPLRQNQRDVITARRDRQHSAKPRVFRKVIETLSLGPRIELFARSHAPGWDVWGIEAPERVSES